MSKSLHTQEPIGIFDSGIGGLTVANAIHRALPNERLIYFGDIAHLPYGDKSADAIRYYCLKISKFLMEQNCKMIVIACNSAATAAYDMLLDFFEGKILFVNVVDPLVEKVTEMGRKKIGVIATKATVSTRVYEQKIHQVDPFIEVRQLATPLLVPMIEEGYHQNKVSHAILSNYLNDPQLDGIDTLLLACTHYPLIKNEIQSLLPDPILVLDSTDVVTDAVENQLIDRNILANEKSASDKFYVSDYTASFEKTAKLFYGEKIDLEVMNIW